MTDTEQPAVQPAWTLRRSLRTTSAESWEVVDGKAERVGVVTLHYGPESVEGLLALPEGTTADQQRGALAWLTGLLSLDATAGLGGTIHWVVTTGGLEDFWRRSPGRRPTAIETDVADARARIEAVLSGMFPTVMTLADGGYAVDAGSVRVFVAVRVAEGGAVLVRVFSITNLEVPLDGELPAFLLSLNFAMAFGRFSIDTEHRAVWCDQVISADDLDETTLARTIAAVASTADKYDDEIKQRFGGRTFREEGSPVEQAEKAGEPGMAGGYL